MARPTLQTGDIWSADLANSSGNPIPDGRDEFGSGPKTIDEWLSDESDQIKARFYGWFNRVLVSEGTGREVTYSGAVVVLASGSQVTIQAGSLTLPENSTNYIFITETGAVSFAGSLPQIGTPLAQATTDGSGITTLSDLRYQSNEQVRLISGVPGADSGGFDIGDVKWSGRQTPPLGWVLSDNTLYNDADYPLAAAALGRAHSLPGDPVGTFRTPAIMGSNTNRTVIGASDSKPLGWTGGDESVALTAATSFKHSHVPSDPGHSHQAIDSGHSHNINDPTHGHPVLGSFETSGGNTDSIITERAAIAGETGGSKGYTTENDSNAGQRLVQKQPTGISIKNGKSVVSVGSNKTNITIGNFGGSQPHPNMQPSVALNAFCRLE